MIHVDLNNAENNHEFCVDTIESIPGKTTGVLHTVFEVSVHWPDIRDVICPNPHTANYFQARLVEHNQVLLALPKRPYYYLHDDVAEFGTDRLESNVNDASDTRRKMNINRITKAGNTKYVLLVFPKDTALETGEYADPDADGRYKEVFETNFVPYRHTARTFDRIHGVDNLALGCTILFWRFQKIDEGVEKYDVQEVVSPALRRLQRFKSRGGGKHKGGGKTH